jgi:tetratricopeptide (TPR) repeat protein
MWFGTHEERVRQIEARAHEALARQSWDEADTAAGELLDLGWSGGFEIRALAASGRGDLERAVRVLEEGTSLAAQAWSLWQLLGIYRSDLGRSEGALDAFARALACEGSDGASIRFNRAIAHFRHRDPGAALDDLELILALPTAPPFAEDALGLAAACLAELGRAEEGLALLRAAHDACAASDPRRNRLRAELACALDRARAPEDDVRAMFALAAEGGSAIPSLLALGRRLFARACESPRLLRIVVDAPMPRGSHPAGVFRVFEVAAEDAERALELARVYLPAASRDAARIDEQIDLGEASGEIGVRWASGLSYYDET